MADDLVELWTIIEPEPGWCCEDAYASAGKGTAVLHTSGCGNRCSRWVPVPDAVRRGLVAAYPCGYSRGHVGDCWLHPTYREGDAETVDR